MVKKANPEAAFVASGGSAAPATGKRNKGGRPPKSAKEKRENKHEVYLSEKEEDHLKKLIEASGKSTADLFRHALFERGIRIARARAVPTELLEMLTDFKRKSGLIQLLAHRERDFTAHEKAVLVGSSSSLRTAVERLQRHVFASLEQVEEFATLGELIKESKGIGQVLSEKEIPSATDRQRVEKIVQKLENWFENHYHHLTLR